MTGVQCNFDNDRFFDIYFDKYPVNDGFLIVTGTVGSIFDSFFDT